MEADTTSSMGVDGRAQMLAKNIDHSSPMLPLR